MISLIIDSSLDYPAPDHFFSPDVAYPEYPYTHLSPKKGPVYRAVRECLAQAGLDAQHFQTPAWNPLGAFIKPGGRVFVLSNFVFHRESRESAEEFVAKCVHGSVLRPLLDYLHIAVGTTGSVRFGNAPMQYCRWNSVLSETGAQRVWDFYREQGVSSEATDLRLFLARKNRLGGVSEVKRRPESDGRQVDLGPESLLSDLDGDPHVRYRVMNYDPRRLESFHSPGRHVYVISRHVLEADVIVSLAKFKTHEKVGLTCSLKSCVGAVGHKDSLPHHRFGSPKIGGDEYPINNSGILHLISAFHDRAQRIPPDRRAGSSMRIMDRMVRKIAGKFGARIGEGAWSGNDTAWRMVLDLARIVRYAAADGSLSLTLPRTFLTLVDGIVAGEEQGPLYPKPVRCGLLLFSDNPVLTDYASALLMGFEPDQMPMIREGFRLKRYPLYEGNLRNESIIRNRETLPLHALTPILGRPFKTPLGWRGCL